MITHAGGENKKQFLLLARKHPWMATFAIKFLLAAKLRKTWNNGKRWQSQRTTSTRVLAEDGLVVFRMRTRRRGLTGYKDEAWTVSVRADEHHKRLKPHEGWSIAELMGLGMLPTVEWGESPQQEECKSDGDDGACDGDGDDTDAAEGGPFECSVL